jgi:NAD(P)-dependent dehydrogenase (short-subunit alcohol dehydrogenase family)
LGFRASGLGSGATKALIQAGGNVAILDQNETLASKLVEEFGASRCAFFIVDVGDSGSITSALKRVWKWIQSTKAEMGGVVAAAGIGLPTPSIDVDGVSMNMDNWDKVMRVNVRGSIDLACQVLPYWSKTDCATSDQNPDGDRGAIILVSSIVAFAGQAGMSAYVASKGAIMAAVLPMARDVSPHNIRVLAIAPGLFNTPLANNLPPATVALNTAALEFPRRQGEPSDFGSLVKHVLENVYMNGTTIRIDGGEFATF